MGETSLEKTVSAAWLTAMLTATGTNAPKSFPKSPDELLGKFKPPKPMNKRQWEAMIDLLLASNGDRAETTKPPKQNGTEG